MSGYTVPPDTRAAGQTGHITDHNNISDDLTTLVSHVADGLTGATAAYRLAGAGTSAGPPASGTFLLGDIYLDRATPTIYVCTTAGTIGSGAVFTQAGATLPMTTLGDLIYENATPTAARLAGNTTSTKNFLTQTGTGTISAAPGWGTIAAADLPTGTTSTQGALQLDGTASDILPSPGTRAAGAVGKPADAAHVHGQPSNFAPTGLTGATAASRYVGATASGAPGSGTFVVGDAIVDQTGTIWICTGAGTPGTWTQVVGGAGSIPGGAAGGDLTGTYPSPTVGTNKISNAKAAQMAALTVKGNQTSATANASDMTAAQTMSILGGLTYALANGLVMP